MPRSDVFSVQTVIAPAMLAGGVRVVPELQVLRLCLPFGGLALSHPTAVVVESEAQGEGRRLGIVDVSPIPVVCALATGVGDKISAATQPGGVYSAPVTSGAYSVITASDVLAAGGHALGSGVSRGHPVATIIVGPDGVKILPVVDVTGVALGVMAAVGGGVLAARLRARRSRK
jgi:hypothetical protein